MKRADQAFPAVSQAVRLVAPPGMRLIHPDKVDMSKRWFGSFEVRVQFLEGVTPPVICKGNLITRNWESITFRTVIKRPKQGESWSF
ncbi:hypothetical protein AB5I39_05285 [Sphingomonas sp. MMS24-J45]|uniref:hypothetical protein n=1 Tax=Sphingomonas sp. MMS24-J45 TaxID=3238806 RepID=UPI00384D6021